MGKIHQQANWIIRVQGNEHPPMHVHVIHPDGDAVIYLDGRVLNRNVPAVVIVEASTWVVAHIDEIRAEWVRVNNPPAR